MKLLVETLGSFMLSDPQTGDEVAHNRPSVVSPSNFIHTRTATQQLRTLANNIPDNLTDADFKKFWLGSDKDQELAVQSFLASFAPKEVKAPAPAPAPKLQAKEVK